MKKLFAFFILVTTSTLCTYAKNRLLNEYQQLLLDQQWSTHAKKITKIEYKKAIKKHHTLKDLIDGHALYQNYLQRKETLSPRNQFITLEWAANLGCEQAIFELLLALKDKKLSFSPGISKSHNIADKLAAKYAKKGSEAAIEIRILAYHHGWYGIDNECLFTKQKGRKLLEKYIYNGSITASKLRSHAIEYHWFGLTNLSHNFVVKTERVLPESSLPRRRRLSQKSTPALKVNDNLNKSPYSQRNDD